MKKLLLLFAIGFAFTQCNEEDPSFCTTNATIRDLTGFDGCGFVLELEDGSFLQPQLLLRCGTPPINDTGILLVDANNFELVDGKLVKISYKKTGDMSICMLGPVVEITCIREVSIPNPEED